MKIPVLREIELFIRKYKKYKFVDLEKLSPYDLGYYSMNFGPAIEQKHLENCKVYANRVMPLELVPKNTICAEIGVAYGEYSDEILKIVNPKELHMIDLYSWGDFWGKDYFKSSGKNHYEWIKDKYKDDERVKIKKGFSFEILEQYPDEYFDYVYVDGGHDYETVKKDIDVLMRKVKDNGIIAFNDYCYFPLREPMEYDVERAVNELLHDSNHEVIAYAMRPSRMDDMVIKIHKAS